MNGELPLGLEPALLDDFFAEADDHLTQIRASLVQLETSGRSQHGRLVEDLLHSFHSLKGISALAGLGAAEAVSHAAEDYLRLLKSGYGQGVVTRAQLELLMAVAQKLEQTIGAFRAGSPLPSNESLLNELRAGCAELSNSAGGATQAEAQTSDALLEGKVEAARARGLRFWKCTFVPSQEWDAQGINIASVREDLSKAGEILTAIPHIKAQGSVTFEFLVAATDLPAAAAWEQKGVSFEPVDPPNTKATAERESGELTPFLAPSHMLRVHLQQLDELMRIAGEMVIYRSRLEKQLAGLQLSREASLRNVQETSNILGRSLRELRESITRLRMVPVAELFSRMPFVVRDLARQTQKSVQLKYQGQDTALDKYLIEKLKDPLLHLVRNAFSHGVETAPERAAASKPETATIELKASTAGDAVIIQVRDDGKGIEPEAILHRAAELGIQLPEKVDNDTILEILCSSGFSTRQDADRAAGRGVGMTVVRDTLRQLGGQLSLETSKGKGTQFTMRLPLTLAVAETFLVSSAGQTCAVPQSFVTEILHANDSQVQKVNGIEAVPYRDGVLPVVRLSGLFQKSGNSRYLLVITSERGSVGLLTEQVLGQKEVVVSALRDPLIQVPGVSGATELGDGKPVLILDGFTLTNGVTRPLSSEKLEPQLA